MIPCPVKYPYSTADAIGQPEIWGQDRNSIWKQRQLALARAISREFADFTNDSETLNLTNPVDGTPDNLTLSGYQAVDVIDMRGWFWGKPGFKLARINRPMAG